MPDQTIKCPNCGAQIPLNEALTGQIEQSIKLRYEAEAAAKEKDYQAKLKDIQQQAKELEAKGDAIDQQVAEQLKTKSKEIAEQEKAKILADQAEQTKALEGELEEKNQKLKEFQQQEIELRTQQRKLLEEKEAFELEAVRKLDGERKKIAEEVGKKAAEENMLKMREKDDQLAAMKKQIDELKRKSEVGSQEAQGEALEGALQEVLQQTFPYDKFEEIKKGARGADILQKVFNTGKECGMILWESKNTKDFQKAWIEKIKKDQQDKKADIAVIMTMTLPKEIDNFDRCEDIWITDYKSTIGLATALRQTLVSVTRERGRVKHQDGMKDIIYDYVTGKDFSMRVRQIAAAYIEMQKDIETEKRSMNRIWTKREKQITLVLENLSGMRGEIEGIVGGQKLLPEVDNLSLDSITGDQSSQNS